MFSSINNDHVDPTKAGDITNLDVQFGINDKNSDAIKASSCSLTLDDDPWAGLKASTAQANCNASTDVLTGEEAAASQGFTSEDNVIQGGDTTSAEQLEVSNLLNDSRYNRDDISGTRTFSDWERIGRFDRGDSRRNAHDVGTIVYRENAEISGNVGRTIRNVRDKNDYFKFTVGKAGEIELSLTGLSGNAGMALYNSRGNLLDSSDRVGNASESITQDLATGDYYARIYNYNRAPWNHSQSNYSLNIERNADALESSWENNITDKSIENAALNSIKYDNDLSRMDVIGILNSSVI